ncbi:ankyrin repeat-containing domain protein [Parasitella parasitica]|nr:ankyrin repeat-containing domain protein [Parasitella parasitica]
MMYASLPRPISVFNDSCFVDIDLSEDVKNRNNEVIQRPGQQIVTIEAEPTMSIWKAAETGNMTALTYFIYNHSSQKQQLKLQEEDDTTETSIARLLNTRDPNTECTLVYLIVANNPNPVEPLRLLLEQGADATARNIYNVQAIHALFLRCPEPLEALQLLLDHDADPNARDGDGWTPIHYAARFCKSPGPVLKILLKAGADVNAIDTSHKTSLFCLLANGDHSLTLDWLIHTAKANIKVRGDFLDGQTRRTKQGSLILQAAKYGRLSSLRILISSASAMESLETILTKDELILAIDMVREQLVKVTERDGIEKLGLMIMILENLMQKIYSKRETEKEPSQLEQGEDESDGPIMNVFEPQTLSSTPPLENVYFKQEKDHPFSCIYLLNLFSAPDMTRYLAETPIPDDVYDLPIHIQKLICEARMEVLVSKQKNFPQTSNNNNAIRRLEKVQEYIKGVAHYDTAAIIDTLNELINDEDEMSAILE